MKIDAHNRQRLLLVITAAAVGLYLLDWIGGQVTDAWRGRATEIARLKKDVARGQSLIDSGPRNKKRWADMQGQALPNDPAQAEQDLISAFDRWGRSSNIELGSIKPQWKRGANDRHSLLECRVDATGSLSTLARFLHEVEKSPLALRVEAVELTTRDNVGQKLTLGLLVSGLRLTPLEKKQ